MSDAAPGTERLVAVTLDPASIGKATRDVEHERAVAVYDILEENAFRAIGHTGPYRLHIGLVDQRLVLDVGAEDGSPLVTHVLSLTPFRKVVRDYFMICESYFEAIRAGSPSRIEAIDMGRRGVHNEGSQLLKDRLDGKIDVDFDTARRLFTLVCALHWRG